jgi:hypothetical protein
MRVTFDVQVIYESHASYMRVTFDMQVIYESHESYMLVTSELHANYTRFAVRDADGIRCLVPLIVRF